MEKHNKIPLLRFPGFIEVWENKKLKDFALIFDGTHQTPNYVKAGIPFYSVEHVTSNNFDRTKFISKAVFENENRRIKIEKGDILMTRIGDIGTSRIIDWNVEASFYVSLALIKQSKKYNSEFFNHYIGTTKFQKELWNRTIHVAFPKKINLGEIGDCEVNFPSLPEQQKIASFLTVVDSRLNQLKQKKSLLEQYKKGLMQKIFNREISFKDENGKEFPAWEEHKLGKITSYVDYRGRAPEKVANGIFLVTAKNIKKGYIDYDHSKEFVSEVNYLNVMSKGLPEIGDVLFTTEAPLGNVAQVDNKLIALAQRVIKFSGNRLLNNNYLMHVMLSDKFQKKISDKAIGTTVQGISGKELHQIFISLPCLTEQTKIGNFLSAMDKKINLCQKQIEKTELYKKGLLQKMFC